jgi:hypothetical protein
MEREANVAARALSLSLLVGVFGCGSACAQSVLPAGARATVKCEGEDYVPVTADAEQAIPPHVVEKAACGETVVVLVDTQGYTVRVRTPDGKSGYIVRRALAVEPAAKSASAIPPASAPASAAPAASASHSTLQSGDSSKPRVYISDTASWTASGGFSRASSVAAGDLYGGYNPEMTDIYQDFTSDCSAMVVTQEKSNADLAVLFDKDTSKKGIKGLGGLVKVNKVTVLSRSGETLLSQAAHSADKAVQMACAAVSQAQSGRTGENRADVPH